MSLLSHTELLGLVKRGVVTNVQPEHINGTSIDITLGGEVLLESNTHKTFGHFVSLRDRDCMYTLRHTISEHGVVVSPNAFLLAHSEQQFYLPDNISAEFKLKSSAARLGLEHLNAGWCDPGWNGSVLTMELKNMTQFHYIKLHKGDRIGQMVFFSHKHVPQEHSYRVRGRYNGDASVQGVRR